MDSEPIMTTQSRPRLVRADGAAGAEVPAPASEGHAGAPLLAWPKGEKE